MLCSCYSVSAIVTHGERGARATHPAGAIVRGSANSAANRTGTLPHACQCVSSQCLMSSRKNLVERSASSASTPQAIVTAKIKVMATAANSVSTIYHCKWELSVVYTDCNDSSEHSDGNGCN